MCKLTVALLQIQPAGSDQVANQAKGAQAGMFHQADQFPRDILDIEIAVGMQGNASGFDWHG